MTTRPRAAGDEAYGYKHRLPIHALLPDARGAGDQCIDRLTERVSGTRGVERAHVDDSSEGQVLCLHYDPTLLSFDALDRSARAAGAEITNRFRHRSIAITGMGCSDCASSIQHIISRMKGVVSISVSYAGERMRVEFDTALTSEDKIVGAVRRIGYGVDRGRRRGFFHDYASLVMAAGAGACLAVGYALSLVGGFWLPLLAYAASYALGGYHAVRGGIAAAVRLRLDIDALMVVAAVGAAVVGQYPEGALLLFLFSTGHALEHMAMGRARAAIDRLGSLAPETSIVVRGDAEIVVPTEELARGDRVAISPGDRIPIDGRVLSGESSIDESTITGESVPKETGAGTAVYAGTVNLTGALVVEVTKLSRETMLSRIIDLVAEAQTRTAPTERAVQRFARVFVPIVLAAVCFEVLVPWIGGFLSFHAALLRAMTLLVAASPCALAIATPAAVLAAIARAARQGILIKGGVYLEAMGRIGAVAFDKTGTITSGKLRVSDLFPAAGSTEDELIGLSAAAEHRSSHPLGAAIRAEAQARALNVPRADSMRAAGGRGLTAEVDGETVIVGSLRFVEESGIDVHDAVRRSAALLQREAKSFVICCRGGRPLGVIGFADQTRGEAPWCIEALGRLGVKRTALLSGDAPDVVERIGRDVGIPDARGGLLPEEKLRVIETLRDRYRSVAMVGDGINDAPALATATVGIAMGAGGADAALETANIALMSSDLSKLPYLISLSRASRRIVRENLVIALAVIALLAPAALLGFTSIVAAIVAHEGSTLLVVGNALRLLGFRTPGAAVMSPARRAKGAGSETA